MMTGNVQILPGALDRLATAIVAVLFAQAEET
jgi:hypothetical protein